MTSATSAHLHYKLWPIVLKKLEAVRITCQSGNRTSSETNGLGRHMTYASGMHKVMRTNVDDEYNLNMLDQIMIY